MSYMQSNEGTKIPKAFKVKKGALHKQLGMAPGKKIPVSTLQKLKQSPDALTRKRATFALNAKKWHHGKGK